MNSRNTLQKRFIKEFMQKTHSHPTAQEVYEVAKAEGISIGLTTVYRILNSMVELKELMSITTKDGLVHYDVIREGRSHFICNKCSKIFDLDPDQEILSLIKQKNDCIFEIEEACFNGICQECKNK